MLFRSRNSAPAALVAAFPPGLFSRDVASASDIDAIGAAISVNLSAQENNCPATPVKPEKAEDTELAAASCRLPGDVCGFAALRADRRFGAFAVVRFADFLAGPLLTTLDNAATIAASALFDVVRFDFAAEVVVVMIGRLT